MRWQSETHTQRMERVKEWHEWFAWRPVKDRAHGYRMWFETVLRQFNPGSGPYWNYRPITILEADLGMQETVEPETPQPYSIMPGSIHIVKRQRKLPRR